MNSRGHYVKPGLNLESPYGGKQSGLLGQCGTHKASSSITIIANIGPIMSLSLIDTGIAIDVLSCRRYCSGFYLVDLTRSSLKNYLLKGFLIIVCRFIWIIYTVIIYTAIIFGGANENAYLKNYLNFIVARKGKELYLSV